MSSAKNAGPSGPAFSYPEDPAARNQWVMRARDGLVRERRSTRQPAGVLWEEEWQGISGMRPGMVVFLVNRECPWRCVMCDLWRQALPESVTGDDILAQVDAALAMRGGRSVEWLKLYNAGSFFDPGAIPLSAHAGIALRCAGIGRLIVESHPALVGGRVEDFRRRLPSSTQLEVAMGLETVHPEAHGKLNKRTSPSDFARAASWLRQSGVGIRIFLMTRPPFIRQEEGREWLLRSVDYALETGADPVVVIPARAGNGAMERLQQMGEWEDAPLEWVEEALLHGRSRGMGRVLADTWGMSAIVAGKPDREAMLERIEQLNRCG